MRVRNATGDEIEQIAALEKRIEGEYAADISTLGSRLLMFPEGFLVGETEGSIVGYLESCRWNKTMVETFESIREFPIHHNPMGAFLYIIFLGVDENFRKRGYGTVMLFEAVEAAKSFGCQAVQLVSRSGLEQFYEMRGFKREMELPHYLPYDSGTFMVQTIS